MTLTSLMACSKLSLDDQGNELIQTNKAMHRGVSRDDISLLRDENGRFKLYNESHALLIGNISYGYWQALPTISDELKRIEAMLKAQGFDVELAWDLNSDQLPKTIKQFLMKYGAGNKNRDNRLLVFYAGHGETVEGYSGEEIGYLVSSDSPAKSDLSGFLNMALGMDTIVSWSKKVSTKHILFLFDSCFSGSIMNNRSGQKVPEDIHESVSNPIRQFITAGGANERVPAESAFVSALIRAIQYKQADYTGDGYVTGTELSLFLKREVPKYSGNHPQEARFGDNIHNEGDFVFALKPEITLASTSSESIMRSVGETRELTLQADKLYYEKHDEVGAFKLYPKAAEQGDADAQQKLIDLGVTN